MATNGTTLMAGGAVDEAFILHADDCNRHSENERNCNPFERIVVP